METKFKVGEFVYIKQDIENWLTTDSYMRRSGLARLMIVETFIQTCYGGVQVTYRLRSFGDTGSRLSDLTEIELTNELSQEVLDELAKRKKQ